MPHLVTSRLIGCQTLKDVTYQFTPGLNVFVATNNVGKSVFFKMLKLCCNPGEYTRDEIEDVIRHGSESASLLNLFSDGSAGGVRLFRKGPVYFFTDDVKKGYVQSEKPDPRLIENLSVLVDDEGFFGNIIDLEQALLLINSSNKSNDQLIKMITRHEKLTFLMNNLKEKHMEYDKASDDVAAIVYPLKSKVSSTSYIDVSGLQNSISLYESGIHLLDKLIDVGREISSIDLSVDPDKDYDFLIESCELLLVMQAAESDLGKLLIDPERDSFLEASDSLFRAYEELSRFKIVDLPEDLLYQSEVLSELYESAQNLYVRDFDESLLMLVQGMEILTSGFIQATELNISVDLQLTSSARVDHLEQALFSNGRRIPCVIYGHVQHINGHCIPIDNGLALEA